MLDLISVPLLTPQPIGFQPENWLLDPDVRWRRNGRIGWGDLRSLEERPTSLWINGYSTSAGTNDQVPVEREDAVADSLKLIRVSDVTMNVEAANPMSNDPRPTVRAQFRYAGWAYALKVTDPVYEQRFRDKGLGKHQLAESFLTVSLGEPFKDGNFYKLVAAIVERSDAESGATR